MRRDTKEVYAMKIMQKTRSENEHWSNENMFKREVQVLSLLGEYLFHPRGTDK